MLDLLRGIVTFTQAADTGFRNFIGQYVAGNETIYGPFLGVAPEAVGGNGPDFPFTVYEALGQALDLGFGGVGASYGEKPIVRFHLYDDDQDRLAQNLETFIAGMDGIAPGSLDMRGDDVCLTVLRKDGPSLMHEPIGKKGLRIYHAMTLYEFAIARIKGIPPS